MFNQLFLFVTLSPIFYLKVMIRELVQAILRSQFAYRQVILRKIREQNIDVSFEMLMILRVLYNHGGMNQQELANKTFKEKSSLSHLIKNMETRSLVKRAEYPGDKRNKMVLMTETGENLYTRINNALNDAYDEMSNSTNVAHIQVCIEYLNEFKENVDKLNR